MIKSRRVGWTIHVVSISGKKNEYKALLGKPKRKRVL
jgi:hypothetical protein